MLQCLFICMSDRFIHDLLYIHYRNHMIYRLHIFDSGM